MRKVSRRIVTALLTVLLTVGVLCRTIAAENEIRLPDIGDPSGALITPVQEQKLGEAFYRSLHGQLKINRDLEIQYFIESLGERLASQSDNPQQPFHFFVVLDPAINAFAGPGGYIGVNSGLILETETESELASVMAHEIAHVTQRHLYRAFDAARKMSIPSAAALLAAILISTQAPEIGQAALVAAQAGNIQYQIDFTRDNEQEADRIGMRTLSRAKFDPRGMPAFFERLEKASRYYGEGPPEFLRTHPVTASRISDTRGRAERFPYRQYLDSVGYQLLKAKLRVLTGIKPSTTIKYFEKRLNRGTETQKTVAHYGYALALAGANRYPEARKILSQLIKANPERLEFFNALAKSEMEAGRTAESLALYSRAVGRFPDNRSLTLDYAAALLKAGRYEEARVLLNAYLRTHKATPDIYQLLSRSHGNLGHSAQSHRYIAEYYYSTGQLEPAITHVRLGLKNARGNQYLSAVLEERLKIFVAEEEEIKNN